MRLLFILTLLFAAFELRAQEEIGHFSVEQRDNAVLVQWTVKAGFACNTVTVERAVDTTLFAPVYAYPGVCGGAPQDEQYQWLDFNAASNRINFYRLNLGSLGVTPSRFVFFVDFTTESHLTVPMPHSGRATVHFNNPQSRVFTFELFDVHGQRAFLKEGIVGNRFDVNETLVPGFYRFRLFDPAGNEHRGAWVVQ